MRLRTYVHASQIRSCGAIRFVTRVQCTTESKTHVRTHTYSHESDEKRFLPAIRARSIYCHKVFAMMCASSAYVNVTTAAVE